MNEILKIILIVVAAIIVAYILWLVINAIISKFKAKKLDGKRENTSEEKLSEYSQKLGEMVKCQTIADDKHEEEFEKFRQIIAKNFPLIHEKATHMLFGNCLIFKIEGKNSTKNIMLMSHHDVVEGVGEWRYPPFLGEVVGDVLWGRGTIDTKTPLFGELQAAEELLKEGFPFEGYNLYIGSSGNEEICGDGIPQAVQFFKEQGVKFDCLFDEGGAIICGLMPGVTKKSAMVAVHEKGRHTVTCVAKTPDKGHLGFKVVKNNPIERMCAFVTEVKKAKIFKPFFSPEVKETFKVHAPYMSFPFRILFSNIGALQKVLLRILPKVSGEVEGMLKTTVNFTSISGGKEEQIQAKIVTSTLFLRCVREEELKLQMKQIEKIAKKYSVELTPSIVDYCKPTSFDTKQYENLKQTLNTVFPDVIVSPFLLTAGTDARHFSDIADNIFRFAPIDLSMEQFKAVHNVNENIDVKNIGECVSFYKLLLKKL